MPNSSARPKKTIRFDVFEVEVTGMLLRKRDRRIKVQDLPFRLLVALLDQPGEIVTRDQLRSQLWGDTVVDFDDSLHTAVRKVRDVLGDSATHPRFIETVPRRGYRFIAPVSLAVEEETEQVATPEPPEPPSVLAADPPVARAEWNPQPVRRKYLWPAALAILVLASATLIFKGGARSEIRASDAVPITSYRGVQRSPALSPDGTRLAFTWVGESGDNLDVYVQKIDGTGLVRLTTDPAPEQFLAWSPDGSSIAFTRSENLLSISAAGGKERRITSAAGKGVAWSPDSHWIAFSDSLSPGGPRSIFLASVETGERRRLTMSDTARQDDDWPTFSPDGKWVGFVRRATTASDIYRVPASGGEPSRVAIVGKPFRGLVWSPDGEYLLFGTGRHVPGLLAVPAKGHDTTRLQAVATAGFNVNELSMVAKKGAHETDLAYVHESVDWDIWGTAIGEDPASSKPLVASIRADQSPSFSPDGKRLAFCSARTGFEEIWVSAADGANPRQLSNFNSGVSNSPRWSPDGRSIAFDATVNGNPDVYMVAADGGPPRRVTTEASAEQQPSWSHDGKWLYFMSDRSGSKQIWKMPASGGPATQLTRQGGFQALESADGRYLYYAKQQWGPGIWRVPVDGGEEIPISQRAWQNLWSLTRDGLYYLDVADRVPQVYDIESDIPVRKINLETRENTVVTTIHTSLPPGVGALEIRGDGKYFTWVGWHDHSTEIMLLRNPHIGAQ